MGPDRFFDAMRYDPEDPVGYLKDFAVQHRQVPLADLVAMNGGAVGYHNVQPAPSE
jgi:hypothetical protein